MKLPVSLAMVILLFIQGNAQSSNDYRFSQIDASKGLSHNQVNCFYKDHKGFMWVGARTGLNRYDGHSFKVFRHNARDSFSVPDDNIVRIYALPGNELFIKSATANSIYNPLNERFTGTDAFAQKYQLPVLYYNNSITNIVKAGNAFWFLYTGSGLYKMDASGITARIVPATGKNSIDASPVSDIAPDSHDNLVIIHRNGIIEKMETRGNQVIMRNGSLQKALKNGELTFSLFVDRQDDIWAYNSFQNAGVFFYNSFTNETMHLTQQNGLLNNNIINGIIQDAKGQIWIGTDHGGINIINKSTFSHFALQHKEDDNSTVAQDCITSMFKDETGIIWAGTYKKGFCIYDDMLTTFPLYQHHFTDKASLSYDDVNKFAEDAKGNIWIGTNGGGLIYFNRKENRFTTFKHNPANANSLCNDVIVSLWIDHEQKLWIGTYFGGLDCYDGHSFKHYRHNDKMTTSLVDDRVWEIYEDRDTNLWVGTLAGGLDRLDRKTGVFYHNNTSIPNSIKSNYISALTEDEKNRLWIGTSYGVEMLNKKTGTFTHLDSRSSKLSNDNVADLLVDENMALWVATRDGLNVFDEKENTFQSFRTEDGLPDNTILNILEDDQHHLWVNTPNGIARIIKRKTQSGYSISCKIYDELDGLQGRGFNDNAALKTRSGEIIMGGSSGFNIFNPAAIKVNKETSPLVFTNFQLFNKEVTAGENINGQVVLPQSISETKDISLKYNQNVFSIEFAALSFENSERIHYAYMLEGFSKDWLPVDNSTRKVAFTNLDPGDYIFHVKASNPEGVWGNNDISLKIHILPPFWKTPLADVVYVLTGLIILFLARRMVIQRAHMRFVLAQERKEAQRLRELDMMKIKFFTNVSHEFRTPLSLILTPLDKIIRYTAEPDRKKQFQLMHRNARRLLNLVNQLLDFRKMEVQELKLQPAPGDVVKFIKDISYSFTDLAEKKNIQFEYSSGYEKLYTRFDYDKLERILFNLLSNAFKFTPENGKVSVQVDPIEKDEEVLLEIKVKDTGIGISDEKQERIFERFFQNEVPDSMVNQGSGIGLAITKEFVRLFDGSISVESEPEKGSCFTILLPFTRLKEDREPGPLDETEEGEDIVLEVENYFVEEDISKTVNSGSKEEHSYKPLVLLIEDNEDFRFYLKDNLQEYFRIAEASNGKAGWQKVLVTHPDLIVSDISMPQMDGIELCKKLKSDNRTKHIPVILLTALIGEDQQLRGLETGAQDYMTKPFNFEIMLSKIRNILAQQETAKKTFGRQVSVKTTDVQLASPDDKFVQQALTIVEKHISDPGFSVEDFSRELCMSRVAVYKKLFALTGKSPLEFIRSIRLQRAAQLLIQSRMTVAEVAYEVGFNNPKYFTRYFKEAFQMVPSVYMAANRNSQKNDPQQQKTGL